MDFQGNCLITQSGGPTAVANASLAGVVTEALNYECFEEIYGSLHGTLGILAEEIVDLASESQQVVRGLRVTPGAALGSSRYKLRMSNDLDRILRVLEAHNIRYFFCIGGNDSQETAYRVSQLTQENGYDLRVIGVPKTVDNDLVLTDHCPGYGSVIKYVATCVKESACDDDAMGQGDLVTILEVMGRGAGWIAAGTSLAKRRDKPNDPPHLIYLPEVAFSADRFLDDVQRVLKQEKFCSIVVGEGLVDHDGNYMAVSGGQTDAFGKALPGSVGDYLKGLVEAHLGIQVRTSKLGHGQRAASHCSSQTDNDEAFLAGQEAVRAAVGGETGKMVTLLRGDGDHYTCETGLADLSEVADSIKAIPHSWINDDGISLNYQFFKYASPLVTGEVAIPFENGVPQFVRLSYYGVERLLEPHNFD